MNEFVITKYYSRPTMSEKKKYRLLRVISVTVELKLKAVYFGSLLLKDSQEHRQNKSA